MTNYESSDQPYPFTLVTSKQQSSLHTESESNTFQEISGRLASSDVKFLRVAWCDNANVIRAKAVSVPRLEGVYRDGVPLVVGGQVS